MKDETTLDKKLDEPSSGTFKEKAKKSLRSALMCPVGISLVCLVLANNGIQSLKKSYYESRNISYDESYCGPIRRVSKRKYQ